VTDPHFSTIEEPDTPPVGWWDRAAILALGGAGCALSYDALQQMAVAIHVRPQLSYLFPLVIDGFIAYGIRALLVMSTAPLRARLYVWTLFGTATTASIWANALHAVRLNQQTHQSGLRLGNNVVAVLSTIAPLALAGAVHLYILITRHRPGREAGKSGTGQDRSALLVPVRAAPDGSVRTGPADRRLARTTSPERARDQRLQAERTADRGPDRSTGPQGGPAEHLGSGRSPETAGPDRLGDREPTEIHNEDQTGPVERAPSSHGSETDPTDRPPHHAEPEPASEPTAVLARPVDLDRPATGNTDESPAGAPPGDGQAEGAADLSHHLADGTAVAADRPRTADENPPPQRTETPQHPADRERHMDHPGGPAKDGAEDQSSTDHAQQHEQRTAQETQGTADRSSGRPAVQGTTARSAPPKAGQPPTLEDLLSTARKAALAEGRMTRRALRPHLNNAGMSISNRRFTDLQRRLYADPALAHLPRPGKRP
jgi:hypothetical protein